MKKIFILTGETSGDKLAASVITKLKEKNSNINYLSVGGSYLNSIGIKSIFDLKEITYLGFTSVLLNIFKIKQFHHRLDLNLETNQIQTFIFYPKENFKVKKNKP